MIGTAMGGFAYGFLEKQFGAQIPSLPLVGKSGAVAIACYFLSPRMKILRDVGIAASAIAGYSFGKTGVVSGDEVVGFDDLAQ